MRLFVAICFAIFAGQAALGQNYRLNWPTEAKLDTALKELEGSYGDVPLGINCKNPNGKAEIIICSDPYLTKLALLTARSKFYATENANRQMVNRRSKGIWTIPRSCSTVECLYASFKEQIESAGNVSSNPFH